MMASESNEKNIKQAAIYFFLATVITWYFVEWSPIYMSLNQKILSCCIAGAKWNVQMIAALVLMDERRWVFLRNIGVICLIGAIILIPYSISSLAGMENGTMFFLLSLVVSVSVMMVAYYYNVKKMKIGLGWFIGWVLCLVIAVAFQSFLVFGIHVC